MKNLVIIGASGHGKVAADIAEKINRWENIYFLDDNKKGTKLNHYDVVGTVGDSIIYKDNSEFFVAIGNNDIRAKIQSNLSSQHYKIATLIHPSAIISENVLIECGTVVMPGVVINSSTNIGSGCIINTSSSIDHDNVIKDFAHISPGVNLAGNVNIGFKTWIGIGSSVVNNVNICSNCCIGAGSVVISDIEKSGTYVGVPVRSIKS